MIRSDQGNDENAKKITIGLIYKTLSLQAHHSFSHALLPWLHDYDVKFPDFIFYRGSKQKTCKNMQWTDGLSNTHILHRNDKVVAMMPVIWMFLLWEGTPTYQTPELIEWRLDKSWSKEKIIRKSFNGRLYLKIIPVKSSQCFLVPAKCKGIN